MSDLDDLDNFAEQTKFSTEAKVDKVRRAKVKISDVQREYVSFSTAKPTLPKLKFLGDK